MRSRSWMAALALATTMIGANSPNGIAGEPTSTKQKVQLTLKLDGLSSEGGDVEIKPGHAGCKFETITFKTKGHPRTGARGEIILDPIEVETMSADRNCSFSITLKEPGQPDKTVRRNLRITPVVAEGKAAKPQPMTCYISSNSLNPVASKTAAEPKTKK